MLIIGDLTIDAKPEPTPEQAEENLRRENHIKNFKERQEKLIAELEQACNMPMVTPEQLSQI